MTNESEHSPVLGGCEVLLPMESPEQDQIAPPKRRTNQRNTANRFGILNDLIRRHFEYYLPKDFGILKSF